MRARTATPRKPPIKAPSPVLSRCQIGKNILKVRAQRVNAVHTVEEFYTEEGKGWLKYCRHVAKCVQCKAFEDQKWIEQDKRFNKSEGIKAQ